MVWALDPVEITGETRWRWVLRDPDHRTRASHEVHLDPKSEEHDAFVDFHSYLGKRLPDQPASERLTYEAERVQWLGTWIGERVLGRELWPWLADRTLLVRVPPEAMFLTARPLDLALVKGQALPQRRAALVYETLDVDRSAETAMQKVPIGDRLRILALFSQPTSRSGLNVRRERWALEKAIRDMKAIHRKQVDIRVLQYGVTREAFADIVKDYPGWDLVHLAGHGAYGAVSLEHSDGNEHVIPAAELVNILRETRDRLKVTVLSTCSSGAGGPSSLVEGLRRELGSVVLAMRYPVRDSFAVELAHHLYPLLLKRRQPLHHAVRMAVWEAAGTPNPGRRPLSIGTPVLFGAAALDLQLATPERPLVTFVPADDRPPLGDYAPGEPAEFVGRNNILIAASRTLAVDSGRSGVLLYGPADKGKTWCATELSYRQRAEFDYFAWWQPVESNRVLDQLDSLAKAWNLQLGWASDWAAAGSDFDQRIKQLSTRLRDLRILLVIDGVDALLSERCGWIDDRFGQLVDVLTNHGGSARVVFTSRIVPNALSAGIEQLKVGELSWIELALRFQGAPRLAHLFADVDVTADVDRSSGIPELGEPTATRLLRLLKRWPRLIEPFLAKDTGRREIAEIAKRLPGDDQVELDAVLIAIDEEVDRADVQTAVALNPPQGRQLEEGLRQLGPDRLANIMHHLDDPLSEPPSGPRTAAIGPSARAGAMPPDSLRQVIANADRGRWLAPLVRLATDFVPELQGVYDLLVSELRSATAPPDPPNRLVVAICAAADGLQFAGLARQRLEQSPLPVQVWRDDISWSATSDARLGGSDLLLFIMTRASTAPDSECRREVDQARDAGVDVIALRAEDDVRPADWVRDLHTIDCVGGRHEGWLQLDAALRFAGSPEGRLDALHRRFDELRRAAAAFGADGVRTAMDELRTRIAITEIQILDPAGTRRRRADAIEAARAREDRRGRAVERESRPRCHNEPPRVPEAEFKDREPQMRELERLLRDQAVRMVALMGPPGIGKTSVVARLLANLRAGTAEFDAEGFVYLPVHGLHPVNAATVLSALVAMVPPAQAADRLAQRLEQSTMWHDLCDAVLDELGGTTVIVVIDNAEDLLGEDGMLSTPDLRELVDRLAERRDHGVRLLLVARSDASGGRAPAGAVPVRLDEGLAIDDTKDFLRAISAGRVANLEDHVGSLHELTSGSPRALELAYGLVVGGTVHSAAELVATIREAQPANVTEFLLGWTTRRLDLDERRTAQALAIFGRPVRSAAVDSLLQDHRHGPGSAALLAALHRRRLVRQDHDGNYYLPPEPDRECVLATIPRGEQADQRARRPPYTRKALFQRAAEYIAELAKRHRITSVEDLRLHFAEIELRIRAEQFPKALSLIEDLDEHLHRRGHSAALVQFLERDLRSRFTGDTESELTRLGLLVRAYRQQDDHGKVLTYVARARELAHRRGERDTDARLLVQLAGSYLAQGQTTEAERHYRLALRRLALYGRGMRVERASAHIGLAMCRERSGSFAAALTSLDKAARLLRMEGRRPNLEPEDVTELAQLRVAVLAGVGNIHTALGDYEDARRDYEDARAVAEVNNLRVELGRVYLHEAHLRVNERGFHEAVRHADVAVRISMETANPQLRRDAHEVLALARLCDGKPDDAAKAARTAARYRPDVYCLAFQGLIALRQGDRRTARATFERAQFRLDDRHGAADYRLLDAEGLVLAGRAFCDEQPDLADASCVAFGAARRMASERGTVDRVELLLEQFPEHVDHDLMATIKAAASGG